MKIKYAFLGVGNMATAIINGLLSDEVSPSDIALYDTDTTKYDRFEKRGCMIAESAAEAVAFADYTILAVKPQSFPELMGMIKDCSFEKKCLVSIAAGITIEKIISLLGKDVAVIRTMPNAPLMIGKGVTALTPNEHVSEHSFSQICRMFSRVGEVVRLPEENMNSIISATSSSPAYVYMFIKAIVDEALSEGIPLDEKKMKELVCRMVIGSAELMLKSEDAPDTLIERVATPGGTTAPAVAVLRERGFEAIIGEAMAACTKRAGELSD